MKFSLLTATAISVLAFGFGGAQAADLAYEPVPVEVVPAFNWSGFYAGVHAGYAWGSEDDNQSDLFGFFSGSGPLDRQIADSFDMDGFVGGIHAGYNWQAGQFVFGVEGDLDYADIKGSANYSGYLPDWGPWGSDVNGTLGLKSDWQASARLRAGYAFDNFLAYATGGVAFAHGKMTSSGEGYDQYWGEYYSYSSSDSNTHVGWTVGLGGEYAFSANWIGRAEIRYSDFGSKTYELDEGPVEASWNQTTITAGLSYKF